MKKVVAAIIAAGVVLVVVFVPIVEVPYAVAVQYEDTEAYYVDEPYQVTETYTETVPLDYEVVESEGHVEGATTTVAVVVRNQDNIAGTFAVDLTVVFGCTFIAPGRIELTSMVASDEKELRLGPNETGTATYSVDNPYPANCALDSWSYDVTPSTKEVEKERTVTEYREVEKERTVTRERTETHYKRVPIFEYLRSRS